MEGWMDENFVKNLFSTVLGETVQVKVIRDRNSGYVSTPASCFPSSLPSSLETPLHPWSLTLFFNSQQRWILFHRICHPRGGYQGPCSDWHSGP